MWSIQMSGQLWVRRKKPPDDERSSKAFRYAALHAFWQEILPVQHSSHINSSVSSTLERIQRIEGRQAEMGGWYMKLQFQVPHNLLWKDYPIQGLESLQPKEAQPKIWCKIHADSMTIFLDTCLTLTLSFISNLECWIKLIFPLSHNNCNSGLSFAAIGHILTWLKSVSFGDLKVVRQFECLWRLQ